MAANTITREEFESLYSAVAPELAGYLRRQGAADVEDLVAEVFTTAWRRRHELPSAALRRAWVYGTARRLLLAESRVMRRSRDMLGDLAAQRVWSGVEEELASASSSGQVVAAALARLSDGDRELLQLTEWEGLTPAELAVALGVRPGTARVRLHRARRALATDPEVQALVQAAARGHDAALSQARS